MTQLAPLFALWGIVSLAVDSSSSSSTFSDLCHVFGVTCSTPLTLATNNEAGVRGVFVSSSSISSSSSTTTTTINNDRDDIPPGTTILQIPLQICIRDDEGPLSKHLDAEWSTRLAANVLDLQRQQEDVTSSQVPPDDVDGSRSQAKKRQQQETWLTLLPDADELRQSLPVHWDDDLLNILASPSSSSSSALLQAAIDASYFARASAVAELQDCHTVAHEKRSCHNALDVVQTRSCRVTSNNNNGSGDLRLLAPLFDMLNHGGTDGANAQFMRHEDDLIVQTTKVVAAGSELLIDYGASARPAWKCLQSYGFVPFVDIASNVEPLIVNGVRYDEVGMQSIPYELVEDVSTNILCESEVALTPQVCTYIADCAEQAANDEDVASNEEEETGTRSADPTAKRLIFELRQSRVRTLMTFARGLRDYHNG